MPVIIAAPDLRHLQLVGKARAGNVQVPLNKGRGRSRAPADFLEYSTGRFSFCFVFPSCLGNGTKYSTVSGTTCVERTKFGCKGGSAPNTATIHRPLPQKDLVCDNRHPLASSQDHVPSGEPNTIHRDPASSRKRFRAGGGGAQYVRRTLLCWAYSSG